MEKVKNGTKVAKIKPDKILEKLISEILVPKSLKSRHWRTWVSSLKDNSFYGHGLELEEWLRKFNPKDLKQLRENFNKFYKKHHEKVN